MPLFHHAVSRQMSGSIHTHCQIYIEKPQIPPSFNNTALSPGLISGKTGDPFANRIQYSKAPCIVLR